MKLPKKTLKTKLDAIVRESYPRPHLGGSVIGHPCRRYILYHFRWAYKNKIESKLHRIFRIGDAIEGIIVEELKYIDIQITHDQSKVSGYKDHGGGSIDGECFIDGVKHLFEAKSMNHTNFLDLQRKKVEESKPQYYNQCQIYMGKRKLDKTLFIAMDKNTSDIYVEIIKFDEYTYEMLLAKEEEIIDAVHINHFPRISDNPSWYQCKYCDAKDVCHMGIMPEQNCRTCAYVDIKENGVWWCTYHDIDLTVEEQEAGCEKYTISELFITS